MKQFLKHNFLILLVLFFGYAAYALANTITRPYTSADYAGGQKAVGSKVNAEFDTIVNWLNGGNISSANIQGGGVATSNIASQAVTSSLIANGNVGFTQLAASNLKITSSSSAFSFTNLYSQVVNNLSTTITVTGTRPVRVSLDAAPATYLLSGSQVYGSYVTFQNSVAHGASGTDWAALWFVRDGSTTAHFAQTIGKTNTSDVYQPCSSFWFIDQPAAGAHTYSVSATSAGSVQDTALIYNCRLVVREEL